MFFRHAAPRGASFAVDTLSLEPVSQAASSAARTGSLHAARRWSAMDTLGILTGFCFMLVITVVNSRGRIFWEDEMLGWLLLRDPSWHHMIHAWNLGADGGGFSFYLLGRGWFRLFGDSALSFRLFSSSCFGLAFATAWVALRRFYTTGVVAFALFNSFLLSPPITMHLIEGRFYGLLVLSTALAFLLAVLLEEAPDSTPAGLVAAAFLVHGLLTTSHVLGIVYSFFLLCGTAALDWRRGRRRYGLYGAVAASWLLLLPEKTSILAAGRVGKPHFWTSPPNRFDVLGAYTGYSQEIFFVLLVLGVAALVTCLRLPGGLRQALRRSYNSRRAVYLLTGCLLLVPVWFLLEGLVGTWLFNSRYLQPMALAWAALTAELLTLFLQAPGAARRGHRRRPWLGKVQLAAFCCLYGAFLAFWTLHHVAQFTPEAPDFTEDLTAHLPRGLPAVVEDAFTFTGLISREANGPVRYMYLLDWPHSINPQAPRLEVTQFHLMENWKLAGYYGDHIQEIDSFLRATPRFLVVHSTGINAGPNAPTPEIGNPIAQRLSHMPGYEIHEIFALDRLRNDQVRDEVWLVCRGDCGAALPAEPGRCELLPHSTACCTGLACKLPPVPPREPLWKLSAW